MMTVINEQQPSNLDLFSLSWLAHVLCDFLRRSKSERLSSKPRSKPTDTNNDHLQIHHTNKSKNTKQKDEIQIRAVQKQVRNNFSSIVFASHHPAVVLRFLCPARQACRCSWLWCACRGIGERKACARFSQCSRCALEILRNGKFYAMMSFCSNSCVT